MEFLPTSFEWWHLPFLFVAGFIAEGYGAIIGGGSILTQPALLFAGVPLNSAIAIDNAAALGTEAGIISETHRDIRKRKRLLLFMFIPMMLGGVIGTWLLVNASVGWIKPVMIVGVLYLLIHAHFVQHHIKPKNRDRTKYALLFIFLFIIGLYNNFIGVGEGTFARIALMLLLGLTFIESHGFKTIATVPIRLYSLVVTAFAGLIIWPYVLTLWVATFLAGKYATKNIRKVPEKYMRSIMTVLSLGFILYLIFFV